MPGIWLRAAQARRSADGQAECRRLGRPPAGRVSAGWDEEREDEVRSVVEPCRRDALDSGAWSSRRAGKTLRTPSQPMDPSDLPAPAAAQDVQRRSLGDEAAFFQEE